MTHRLVHVGLGGQGTHWVEDVLPPNVEAGRIEVAAAVDTDPDRLERAEEHLGLPPSRCYTDLDTALTERDADFVTVVTPPGAHEVVVDTALEHGCDILSEKPIADTLEASVRIARKVADADAKMGITMSHRFDRDKTTFRRAVRDGSAGPIDYLAGRFAGAVRKRGYYSPYVYEMDDLLLLDGAVHHLDILASLADAPCERVYAETWTPEWADYAGHSTGFVTLTFADDTRAIYEGSYANATERNGWGNEMFRAECRDETVVLDRREVRRYPYRPHDASDEADEGAEATASDGGDPEAADGDSEDADGDGLPVPLADRATWGNAWLVEQFCDWLDGGEPMATNVHDNLQSMAIVFAAIESSRRGEPVDVQALLDDARADA
ncbi:Gfo/Idh/MocA family oxidoreductase [Halomicroarcula sp. GCM10025817]|uniref:Gfo/Idh/MocA family oxidoreductase n=1 Tax=Haloarcula TaxID=2237 RepID=UPI0023E83E6D|nr:Gfo/Idh/MocA family oxidoreductase [Halomicroarcula sp. SYNS111]